MIARFRHSIRGKLTGLIMMVSAAAVLLAGIGFMAQVIIDEREQLDSQILNYAQLIAARSVIELPLGDRREVTEVLSVLRTKPSFIAGCVYTDRNVPFATYSADAATALPRRPGAPNTIIRRDGRVELFLPIVRSGKRIGTVYIASDQRDTYERLKENVLYTAAIVLVCLVVAFILSSRLHGRISGPIVELACLANSVSQHRDYTVRAQPSGLRAGDEISDLVTGFNNMLAEIEQSDRRLLAQQAHLEETVALRTGELTTANEELMVAKSAAEKASLINARLARESTVILNSATDGIMGLDLDNRPTFLNPAGVQMIGMTVSDMEGKTVHAAIHHSHPDGTAWAEADCANTQALGRSEAITISSDTFWRRDGTSFPVEYSSNPMFDEKGNPLGAVMMFRDVTERRTIERLKHEFVSTVSHELRTPLTSIRGALGLLSSGLLGPIAEKAQRMLEIAVSNSDRLVRLINDILDLERIDSGKVELARGPVDADTVMLRASEGLQSMADQAGVRLVVVPSTGALWGDSDRIIQILTNLLGNAIKFSEPDTAVTLSGTASQTDFEFCVADQGRGVPEENLQSIFERFSQVDASDSREKGGSGLGLAICHSIVQAHGGRIWAERNDPAGSRFRFTIPLEAPAKVFAPAFESLATRTILIGKSEQATNVMETLERGGFRVVLATSSADLHARAAELHPDAIILELADGNNSRQIVKVLKANEDTRDIPIVLVAGQVPRSYESYAAAVARWVHTPLAGDDLIQALDQACSKASILVVEDDLDLAHVMTTALRRHGIRTVHAATGMEAVRLCQQQEPSLIVLDLVLPDIDGFAVVNSLRTSATLGRVPLLVFSALEVDTADQSRLRLGPTEFLTKGRSSLADFEQHAVRLLDTVTSRTKEGRDAA